MPQEVHCTERSFEICAAEWGYKAFSVALQVTKQVLLSSSIISLPSRF